MAEYTNEFQRENCVICLKTFNAESSPTAVGKKGLNTLIDFSKRLNWKNLENYLKTCHHENTKILVHKICRRNFTDVRRSLRNLEQEPVQSKQFRSSIEPFSWKTNCFLCSKEANMDKNHPDRDLAFSVTTILFQNEILERCQNRNDEWGCEVEARLSCRSDLVTDGVYHKQCLRRFMLNWPSPDAEPKPVGQATDEKMLQWFNMLCIWLEVEADGELYTVRELHTKMSELAEGVVVYSVKWLREKLKDRYQQSIYFAQIDGRSDVVCFRNMADYIISDKWYESRKVDKVKDAERIVITAAKLIMAEIQEKKYDTSYYPKHDDIVCHEEQKEWMPNNLKKFLEILIGPPVKQNSIGQRIVHASHPRSGN